MLDNNTLDEMRTLIYIGQNKNYQHQERLDALFAFEKIYMKLSKEEKRTCEMLLYLSYRERAALYFTTNINSKECNIYFEKSFQIVNNGDYDSDINVCISKSMYCKSLILSGLSEKRIADIDKARKCFEEIETKLRTFGRPDVLESINKIKVIFNQIDAKNIWTVVNFEIPYYINLPDSTEYEYIYQGLKCKVKSTTIESPRRKGYICKNAYLFNKQDKYGLLNYSRITVFINEFIEPCTSHNVNRELKDVWLSVSKAVEAWNYFLNLFKVATNQFWLDNINEFMILNYETQIYAGEIELRNVPLSYSLGMNINEELPCISEAEEKRLIEVLQQSEIWVWQTAYLDALNQLQVRNYRESIVQINIALENYLYIYAKKFLTENIGEEETRVFLEGNCEYNDFYLKDYIVEEVYDELVRQEVIRKTPPTTYGIIKKCSHYWGNAISRTRVQKLISVIRKYRNDIVHGVDIKDNLKGISENAVKAFEDLIELLKDRYKM